MKKTALLLGLAVAGGAAVILWPVLVPSGPQSGLDPSKALDSGNLLLAAAIVFAGGLLTALTPCVYPLIPITVAVFSGGSGDKVSRGRRALLTACYALGISLFFSAVGGIVAATGLVFGKWLSYPPVLIGFACFFALLAASIFGAFELALPPALALRLNQVGGAGLAGAFSMGLVAGVVAAPCTGPVMFGILGYIVKQQSVPLGLFLPFWYGLGIGAVFFLIGVFSLSFGKSGPWMDAVKSLMGISLLVLAVDYLRDALPWLGSVLNYVDPRVGYLAAALTFTGLLIGAIHLSFHGPWRERMFKAVGVAMVVWAFAARFGFEGSAQAECLKPGDPRCKEAAAIAWVRDVNVGLAQAKTERRPAFIDFYADWCGACKELDLKTYPDPRVRAEAKRFVPIKVDGTRASDQLDATYDKFGVEGLPTVIFVDSQGNVLKDPRVVGFITPAEMLASFAKVK